MLPEAPPPDDPHVRHLRRMFLAVVTGSFVFLVPWIGYLSASLPDHHEVDQWRLAWVGFDIALIVAIGITALCAWRRLQIFIPWAVVTATLLACDAWFDIVLDWNSDELTGSILTAVFAELPLAALLLYVARKVIRLTVVIAWRRAGRTGPVPPLSRLSLIVLTADEKRDRDRAELAFPRSESADRPGPAPHADPAAGAAAGSRAGSSPGSAAEAEADAGPASESAGDDAPEAEHRDRGRRPPRR